MQGMYFERDLSELQEALDRAPEPMKDVFVEVIAWQHEKHMCCELQAVQHSRHEVRHEVPVWGSWQADTRSDWSILADCSVSIRIRSCYVTQQTA